MLRCPNCKAKWEPLDDSEWTCPECDEDGVSKEESQKRAEKAREKQRIYEKAKRNHDAAFWMLMANAWETFTKEFDE